MGVSKRFYLGMSLILIAGLVAGVVWLPEHGLVMSLLLLGVSFLILMIRFELRRVQARELVLLAVLGGVAAVSRIPFATLPSVQPTTFVIMMTGLVFGSESGFIVGCLAALVSNMLLGQGPWTPWQMLAWGFIGGAIGLLKNWKGMRLLWIQCLVGALAGYFFGWVMNIWEILSLHLTSWKECLALYSGSFYFDTAHAATNVIFLALFSKSWGKQLSRFKVKYGILEKMRRE